MQSNAKSKAIRIRGACQNNLKNLDLDIPLGKITVVTGVSGSGKSSLAFDTLYAEGQRRYVETFSAYTRQFLDRMSRPQVESIDGIPAAVAIDQSNAIKTSRSTVGTMTGINDYLKVLFSRSSEPVCPHCDKVVVPENSRVVVDAMRALPAEAFPVLIVAPLALGGFESEDIVQASLRAQGYQRFLREGQAERIDGLQKKDLSGEFLEVVIDRIASTRTSPSRLSDSADQAFRLGRGSLSIVDARKEKRTFHDGLRCGGCDYTFPHPSPGLFSFNTPYGACPTCRGFGKTIELDINRVIPNPRLSIRGGAIKPWTTPRRRKKLLECLRFCEQAGIEADRPFEELSRAERKKIIDGQGAFAGVRGFFDRLEAKKYRMHVRVLLARYRGYVTCQDCKGGRLKEEAYQFKIHQKTLRDLWSMPIHHLREFFARLAAEARDQATKLIVDELHSRLIYLDSVGLDYLTLDRQSRTLSGGEVERVNLTTALGASLVETVFVLDEPSIGLHARDNARLLEILRAIRDRGNTVVVVEHDPDILRAADHIIDLGPGAGEDGGRLVASGPVDAVAREPDSVTGDFLAGRRQVLVPDTPRRPGTSGVIAIRGAQANNLKSIDVDIPLGLLAAITGVSGSGKSTLLETILYRASRRAQGLPVDGEIEARAIRGLDQVDDVVMVDQSSIGRTSRGNPATYIKVYNAIRDRFAATRDATRAGFGPGHFSFNVEGGRCPECGGAGAIDVEMQFLSDVRLPCESCGGKRFRDEVLSVHYRGLNVAQTLDLTVREAIGHFADDPQIVEPLCFLDGLGLGYLRLGQSLNTLSGGESQRLKLAGRVLSGKKREKLLFLLDEPTTGLHLADVDRLLMVLRGLVERGHSVVVIEHHLDVIAGADWVIDLGPEGGERGGEVVASGPPEAIKKCAASLTGAWLKRESSERLESSRRVARKVQPAGNGTGKSALKNGGAKNAIRIVGARENNLKNLSIDLPRDQLVVVTGMSGSGKSSLLYDIVYAEGQRRYLDCLSPYARQFVEELHRPDIDHLEGIPPTVAIEQRTTIGGRKSTVGTVTEIYQFLRLLYTRVGEQHCPDCACRVKPRRPEEIRAEVESLAVGGGRLLAPVVRGKKGFHHVLLGKGRRLGIGEARIDGKFVRIPRERELRLERQKAHDIDFVVGRFKTAKEARGRVRDALDLGLELAGGVVVFLDGEGDETVFSQTRSCPDCGRNFPDPDPRNFSFNSRHGACQKCDGYGTVRKLDPEQLLDDWNAPLNVASGGPLKVLDELYTKSSRRQFVEELAEAGVDVERPPARLGARPLKVLLNGKRGGFVGLRGWVEEALEDLDCEDIEHFLRGHGVEETCARCRGSRLDDQWAAVRVGGLGIAEVAALSVREMRAHFEAFRVEGSVALVADPIVREILDRLRFLEGLGLGYLGVNRRADTLSGGEAQRIRLAAQLGSNLRGVCYILDEPTIGLHGTDCQKLIESLRELRDRGNSVLIIEHDEVAIAAADHIVDLGPGPGHRGGEVVASGSLAKLKSSRRSLTGKYFREEAGRRLELSDGVPTGSWISVHDASLHNLRGLDLRFPVGALTVVTGVSGAGKSTLVRDILEKGVRDRLRGRRRSIDGCRDIRGWEAVTAVREVDQRPIGRTPRSTPATYVGFWNNIRRIFASTPDAKVRGFGPARFSFNVKGGRCERCLGQGRIKMEMSFLPDVHIDCDLCRGERFELETLQATYRGKSIADVLQMEVGEARDFFKSYRDVARPLDTLDELGLGYLTLGQASTTLSGGEAQRVKLAVELSKSTQGCVLYLLDEPTIGLHMYDVANLAGILKRLAERGHAVVVIEHHMELLARADWLIELGPGGGDAGGELIYEGPPAGVLDHETPTSGLLRGPEKA